MAFVPDDAIRRKRRDRLTPAAWDFYEAHCLHRNHRRGVSRADRKTIAEDTALSRSGVKNATAELRHKGWIHEEEQGVRLLVGDFTPVDKRHQQRASNEANGQPAQPQMSTPRPEMRPGEPQMRPDAYRGSRARSDQPSTSHLTSTHTPARAGGGREAQRASVCVPDLTFEDYLGYARSEPGFTNPPAWAMKHFPLRDADSLVREWKQRRELTLEGRTPVEEKLEPFHVAAQKVNSVSLGRGDVAAFIAGMIDVSEVTRSRLRATFLGQTPKVHVHASG